MKNAGGENKIIISHCKLEVCCACQNNCRHCGHGQLRRKFPDYHLELRQLQAFLDSCKESGYFFKQIGFNGPGEPLLWKYFAEGVSLIKSYNELYGEFGIVTNGMLLPAMDDAIFKMIDYILLSDYGDNSKSEGIRRLIDKHPQKITRLDKENFTSLPSAMDEFPIPCKCYCAGPMLFGDNIFLHCGPPVFGAALLMGVDVRERYELYTPVAPGWFDKYINENAPVDGIYGGKPRDASLDLCRRCWANSHNFHMGKEVVHSSEGGDW